MQLPIGLGVEPADAQVGADEAGVVIGEGSALVGVELGGQAAAAQGFFERVMEGLGVGPQAIGRLRNEARVVVDEDTQEGGPGFAARGGVQVRAGGKNRSSTGR
jgi:hypothetical protein